MHLAPILAALLAAAAVLAPLEAGSAATPKPEVSTAPDAAVLGVAARVADWQLARMDRFDYVPTGEFRSDTAATRDWIQAAFYIGLTRFADISGQPRYADAIIAHGQAEGWGFDARPRHADADATGAVWVWAARKSGDAARLAATRARFDAVLANPSKASLEFVPKTGGGEIACQARWCWSDALFMAPPAWMALSRATGDGRYLAHADAEFWATTDYLYDKDEHLYFRDSRFIAQRDAEGRKIFWGRGNGWVFAGLARILDELPADHPSRPRYEALFRQMAAKIVGLQGAQGYWPVSLLVPQATPETSGTGFFVSGLAWGINHGLLPAADYRPAVDRGWRALTAAVESDGKLGWVQRVGAAPDQVSASDTQLYGVGAFLLAASEVARLPGPVMPPVVDPLPRPDAEGLKPRATVMLAPYRYDDILWENDRTAHRIYGHALEAAEPPSSSGIDAWGKAVRWPFMDRQLRTGEQHDFHGEGLDFYDVNTFRGAGGLGVWQDNKLWVSRNWKTYEILRNGPDVASFKVSYAPWPIDVDRKVWETRTFTLPLGTNFTRMVSTIGSDRPGLLIVGIGINKRRRGTSSGVFTQDLGAGRVSFWEPADPVKGAMGIALMVDPKALVEVRQDADNYLVLVRAQPGRPFVYYMGAAWDKGLDFHDRAGWEAYVRAQTPDFDPRQ